MVIIPSRDVNMSQVEHDITARSTLNPQLAQADFLFPFFLGSPIFDETFMPLIVSLPLLCALGARIAFTFLNSDVISPTGVDASLEYSLLDLIVQGAFQGVLFQYVQSEHPIFAPALALLCIGRAGVLLFTSEGSEAPKIGVSAAAAIIGFAVAYLASSAFEEWTGVDEVVPAEGRKTRHSYRKKDRELARELAREARKQHMPTYIALSQRNVVLWVDILYAGRIRSPHVLIAAIPPKNMATPVTMLKFPGIFSGAKISVRRNAEKADSFGSARAPRGAPP